MLSVRRPLDHGGNFRRRTRAGRVPRREDGWGPAVAYAVGVSKRYLIRTHGCQMNEHDSERIAGLFEADGMVPADGIDDADVVVLNTCCIRENADNKLYGTLGHLKSVKAARPELEIVVGGCLAQKDRDLIQEKAGHVDVGPVEPRAPFVAPERPLTLLDMLSRAEHPLLDKQAADEGVAAEQESA